MIPGFKVCFSTVIACVIVGLSGIMLDDMGIRSSFAQSQNPSIAEGQRLAAIEIRPQLPMRLDEYTVWQTVVSAGPVLMYGYSIDLRAADLDLEEFRSQMIGTLTSNACNTSVMRAVLDAGGRYAYMYQDSGGIIVLQFEISATDCSSK